MGDVIALCESSQPPAGADGIAGRNEWFPCSEPWSHAQVIAIYRNGVGNDELPSHEKKDMNLEVFASEVTVRIRWFNRISEALIEARAADKTKTAERLQKNGERFRSYRGE